MTNETTDIETTLNENMFDEEIWMATQTDDSDYIKFDNDIMKVVTFTSNDPEEIFENDYGNETWGFEVIDAADKKKRLDVSSMRLKKALFQAQPLITGRIGITKTGEKFETQYAVEKFEQ